MSLIKRLPLWLVIVLSGAMVALLLHLLKPSPKPKPPLAPSLPQVKVVQANPAALALPVHSQGTVAPRREIDLVAEVAGKIVSVAPNFVSGAFFTEADILVNIDSANYLLAEIRAAAKVADAQQLFASEKGRALQAKREWRDLGNEDANKLFLRVPQLAAAEAAVSSAKADLAQTQLDIARTNIAAPFSGRIRETYVNLGQYVSPGTKIARIFDSEVVEVRLPITDAQAALLALTLGFHAGSALGPKVELIGTVAGKEVRWPGRITRTEASLDTKTRMYHAIAEVVKSELGAEAIAPVVGLFVDAKIDGRLIDDVIQLPRSALVKNNLLLALDDNNRVVELSAKVLSKTSNQVWLQADLQPGAWVITERQGYLQPGLKVEPLVQLEPDAQYEAEVQTRP
ncbi:efflux RND transporter periplasmic adaptor subunit [Simiduia curdlanivorans]|uniref:Efflux RND transporter periplasmic adaptor subunit n=1 Tax=Simiduia curdlanivorans TaxID=1492769 RepID=A0ABV8V238_9GAMM|nr:efflux RND transporter periplasmic adaptor subunit [Simiduia curdlanivorans]MDN3637861.1 efflux RND transporter periplasmic adaptor subunit [Simiduia curdlanivorans]